MADRSDLVSYCNELLDIESFKDYCPNGLQVEGKNQIKHIVSGVTASQALIDAAIDQQADLILVHHGFFWKGEAAVLTGMKQRRIKSLLLNDINLLAYHLPLDAHKTFGNNAVLAQKLGINIEGYFAINDIALYGSIEPRNGADFAQHINTVLQRQPLHIDANKSIAKVALCTGAAQSYLEQAIDLGVDAFISGEVSENTWHMAHENSIHYYGAGHHATERYGVQTLGEHIAMEFDITHQFIDIHNPI